MMDNQPWFMRNFGPQLISEKQADALERKVIKGENAFWKENFIGRTV